MRQKIVKPDSEAAITRAIRYYLRMKRIFHWKNHAGLGSEKGVPDIIGVMPNGQALFIEIKTLKGKLSEYQQNFIDNAKALGALCLVARSVDDVMEVIK